MVKTTLGQRIISGLAMLGIFIWYIFAAPENIFILITFFLAAIGTYEFHRALLNKGISISFTGLMLNNAIFYLAVNLLLRSAPLYGAGLLLLIPLNSLMFAVKEKKGQPKATFLWSILAIIWISFPFSLLIYFRVVPGLQLGTQMLLWVMFVVSGNDTFAYFGGKRFGKHLLAPSVSPKKTIEGSLFGIIGGITGSFLAYVGLKSFQPMIGLETSEPWIGNTFSTVQLIWMPLVLVPFSQLGDLVESKFKRYCGIKDSSNIIPGHGGILDRTDAFLLAIPLFFILTCLTGAIL